MFTKFKFQDNNPDLSTYNILYRLYPYNSFLRDGISAVENLLRNLKVPPQQPKLEGPIMGLANKLGNIFGGKTPDPSDYIQTSYQNNLITEMMQTNAVSDFCLIGPRGCGKNIVVNKLAEINGKEVENIVLYQDITSRDLVQQRTTLDNGDTIWRNSALIDAALEGKIAIVDGNCLLSKVEQSK